VGKFASALALRENVEDSKETKTVSFIKVVEINEKIAKSSDQQNDGVQQVEKDIKDIYEIRSRLEGLCAKWAAENITKEQLDELEENIFLSDFHATKGNAEQMVELDNKFHEILYTASGSRELRHVLSDFHHYAQRVRKITLSDKNRAVDSNNEHRRIVEALKQHDAQLAETLANQHIMKTIENMDHYGWDNLLKK
jgi:DNA-binding GntR family transcriptional regulator